jgi:putative transposase
MKSKRHSRAEISAKLKQAGMLAAAGKVQSEIAKALGVSVMTLHRWRKLNPARAARPSPASAAAGHDRRGGRRQTDIVAALQMENRYLRQIVADLLLEKIRLEETAKLGSR